ncbi:sensor histidine kinase, partial [Sphingomonas sp. CCH9-F2]
AAVDVSAIVTEVAEAMVPIATEGDRRLIVEGGGEVPLRGDRQLLSQAAFNLVENALNHTPPGTTVWIGAARAGTRAILSVRDDGPGIAPADRAAALRRFGRLDASRHQPGHGLGLPLIDAVARLHRGTLTLADGAPGLIATLDLPVS